MPNRFARNLVFTGATLLEAEVKWRIAREMYQRVGLERPMRWPAFRGLIEDLECSVGESELKGWLRDMHIWEWSERDIWLRDHLELPLGVDQYGELLTETVKIDDLLKEAELGDSRRDIGLALGKGLDAAIAAFQGVARWASERRALPPTFWRANGRNDIEPDDGQPSALTLIDTLRFLYLVACGRFGQRRSRLIDLEVCDAAFAVLMAHVRGSGENLLYVDGDDDFVERDLLPNVPTNAQLAILIWHRLQLGSWAAEDEAKSIARHLYRFLREQQLDDGGWTTRRYADDKLNTAGANSTFSVAALEALSHIHGILKGELELAKEADISVRKALEYCEARARYASQAVVEEPKKKETVTAAIVGLEAVGVVARIGDSLDGKLAHAPTFDDLARRFKPHAQVLIDFMSRTSFDVAQAFHVLVYRPGRNGFLSPIPWEQHAAAKVGGDILDCVQGFDLPLSVELCVWLDSLCEGIGAQRGDPLWKDFRLKDLCFPSNSTVCCTTLLKWMERALV